MHALVTGAAGFIGSTLVDALLGAGWTVLGLDALTDSYDPAAKRANLAAALDRDAFTLVEADVATVDLAPLLDGVDVVFHQAAQPGVRLSWSHGFDRYVDANVIATQRLLEACLQTRPDRIVYASSSSVYGNAERYPTAETVVPRPFSPYGVTKLAGEHLCGAYAANHGLATVSLRYFTVYGPRQRPDMAFHRAFEAALSEQPFPLFGDGSQRRDFTFVGDIVAANLAAATAPVEPGTVCNVSGGGSHSMAEVLDRIGELVGAPMQLDRRPAQAGDVRETGGDASLAAAVLGWSPTVSLDDGLRAQLAWHRARRA